MDDVANALPDDLVEQLVHTGQLTLADAEPVNEAIRQTPFTFLGSPAAGSDAAAQPAT